MLCFVGDCSTRHIILHGNVIEIYRDSVFCVGMFFMGQRRNIRFLRWENFEF